MVRRSFTKQAARRFPEARRLACLPTARPAERGWRHSTQGCQCQRPLSQGPAPGGRPPAPRPRLPCPGPHCQQFWLRKVLRAERAGAEGTLPGPAIPFPGRSRQTVSRLLGSSGARAYLPPPRLLPDGGASAQGRWSAPRRTQSESLGTSAKPLWFHPQG